MSELAGYFDKIAQEFNGYYTGLRPSLIQEIGYRLFRGPGLKRRFEHTIKIIDKCEDSEILDVGCGPGVYIQYFTRKGARVSGIDISQRMVALARENLSKAGIKDCILLNADFLDYEFKKTFDYTLAIGFFDYIGKFERDRYFNKLEKITKKKIVATFPKRYVFQTPLRRLLFFIKGRKVSFYTKKMIVDMAKKYDLSTTFYNSGPIWTVEFTKG